MGRKARAKRTSQDSGTAHRRPVQRHPNWPLLALSAAGILLTSYILWTDYVGNQLKGCSVGSACDVVLSSKWGHLLGAPTAFWGFVTYATLAIAAARWHPGRWRLAWVVSVFGVCYSVYLTTVSLTMLQAACPYCLTSLVLMTAIAGLTTFQRPELPSFSWARSAGTVLGAAGVFILFAHLNYVGVLGEPPATEDPGTRALAIHLSRSGAKMYGASWCPHCQEQKAMFGASASRLPYVECSTGPQGSPQTAICRNLNISIYPTWIIDGKRTEEVMTLAQLAEATGFRPDEQGAENQP